MSREKSIEKEVEKTAGEYEKRLKDLKLKNKQSVKVMWSYAAFTVIAILFAQTSGLGMRWYLWAVVALAVVVLPFFTFQLFKNSREIKKANAEIEFMLTGDESVVAKYRAKEKQAK